MISNKIDNHFPPAMVFTGWLIFIGGFISLAFGFYPNLIIAAIIFLGAGFICFTTYGVVIDVAFKKIKQYNSFFGIKTGKWVDIESYREVKVSPYTVVYTTFSRTNRTTAYKDTLFAVYLVDPEADDYVLIKKLKTKESAEEYAKSFGEKWKKND